MGKIEKVTRLTDNPYVNLYELSTRNKKQQAGRYYVASRGATSEKLKLRTGKITPDGVEIIGLYGEKKDRIVLIRQYRCSIDDYIYEFPAGLVEEGEEYHRAAIREMREETGLTLTPLEVDRAYEKPYFTTVGLTDEACATVYGYASGQPSIEGQEDSEEIEVVLADRVEAARILKEEHVAIMCAYTLMHFIHDADPFAFLKDL